MQSRLKIRPCIILTNLLLTSLAGKDLRKSTTIPCLKIFQVLLFASTMGLNILKKMMRLMPMVLIKPIKVILQNFKSVMSQLESMPI